ncbi:sulfatase-like hydrolase/transferase [Gracilibacillus caseinilyticus]|uniref:Sulfatase-like hydrolase/transferase n=1 Tax=Gracilibacillus caseinilyticus TaxID=2932256 RepID=A0ABY4F132_9BACI|nr:sulfatase [Gracilibacillus caseinilyticus]UOQ50379.1 sulfatase-like hydrolase/transferase [Gracilibacillus caseinilyticus]
MKQPNVILFGIDSLRRDFMSSYGYHKQTTPHMDKVAKEGVLFENHFSPSIPTTPGYASMLSGLDCFGTDTVALRHEGDIQGQTLAELLGEKGYNTSCVGFSNNPSARGFQNYLDYEAWLPDETGRCPKAQNLNEVAIPELRRLHEADQPFFLFMRHMDPHSPYLPPKPFERIFYDRDELDPANTSMGPVYNFKPHADFFKSWIPEGVTDQQYVTAQYEGAIAYMDACIQNLLTTVAELGIEEETLIILTSDHGETLYEHDCYFDHHGMYDNCLIVPLIIKYPGKLPEGKRIKDVTLIKDIMPTILELIGVESDAAFDGQSLLPMVDGSEFARVSEFYITECTWMRKHGWRTPEWKFIQALEPDFHDKPEIELYNLVEDPGENHNLAAQKPQIVKILQGRMHDYIAKREAHTGRENPMYTNTNYHGLGTGPFQSSQEAYDKLYLGSIHKARALQAKD